MGIPHLISHLQPYAKSGPLTGDSVIDGPAFAYHVYYTCLNNRPSSKNAFEAAPTYHEVGKTAIAWLDGLVASGMNIKKIYFDGYLPPFKLNTRLERLGAQTRRLIEYHASNPKPCRAYVAPRDPISRNLFGESAARAHLRMISPPAFLVPAVIDALQNSKHLRDIVITVPDEADIYCANHVKKYGGTVITGDSDLLVHDLGLKGSVCLFKDIQVGDGKTLWGHIYTPANIKTQLKLYGVDGIRALAYELICDQHSTLPNLLARVSISAAITVDPEGYRRFCNEYAPSPVESESELVQQSKFVQALQSMDPRISEYVLQFPSITKVGGHTITQVPHVFLPFLLDWPERTSAWEMSTPVRQLAYGIVNLIVPDQEYCFTAFEHRRQQTKSSGREWQLPSLSQIPEACSSLFDLLNNIRGNLPNISEEHFWIAAAVYYDVEWSSSREKPFVSKEVQQQLNELKNIKTDDKQCSWAMIQFLAMVQGSYYSFRILKQILTVVLAHPTSSNLPHAVHQLNHQLETLPTLDADIGVLQGSLDIAPVDIQKMLVAAYNLLGLEDNVVGRGLVGDRRPKKKRRKPAKTAQSPLQRRKRDNPFEVLIAQ